MDSKEIMKKADEYLLHTYNRFPVVMDHGEGVYLYDNDGKKYLDFAAGIAVYGLGYSNLHYQQAVTEQMSKIVHTSNLFYHQKGAEAAEKLAKAAGMDRVFFTNSGTEAIEGAIKLAKKYAWMKDGSTDHEIIAMRQSFHGRSLGALSVTGNDHYQEPFRPLIGGVKFAAFNDAQSVKALVNEKTCAILFETLQGEGGIYPADEAFIAEMRKICDEKGILLILDEIQCGMGRTGKMFCFEHYGIRPDVVCVAKALGNGLPVGAFCCREEFASLVPGDHGTTYGGNPLATAAACAVLDEFDRLKLAEHAAEIGKYLEERLDWLKSEYPVVTQRRGKGLMQGIVLSVPVGQVITEARNEGLIIISAEGNVIRFIPPLVIEKEHVDEMISKLAKVLGSAA